MRIFENFKNLLWRGFDNLFGLEDVFSMFKEVEPNGSAFEIVAHSEP
jgi:hypothetical protein